MSTPDGIWSTVGGATTWTEVQTERLTASSLTPSIEIESAPVAQVNRTQVVPLLLIGSGAGLAVTGSLLAMRSYRQGMVIRDQLLDDNQIDPSLKRSSSTNFEMNTPSSKGTDSPVALYGREALPSWPAVPSDY